MEIVSSMHVARCRDGFVVRIVGNVTMRESPIFHEFVVQCFQRPDVTVFVELSQCGHVDSTFLGCLIELEKRCQSARTQLVIVADESVRMRLLTTAHIDKYVRCIETCPANVSEFVALEVTQIDARELGRHVMQSHRALADLGEKDAATFRSIADQLAKEIGE